MDYLTAFIPTSIMKKLIFLISIILYLLTNLFTSCNNPIPMKEDTGRIHAFRLKPGMDLKAEIESFVKQENIEAGWIITAVGSLTRTNLRYANSKEGTKMQGHFEIVSLVGTLSKDGCHLHLSVSDSLGRTSGGHLLDENMVYTTVELVIGESREMVFSRENDGSTEWKELQIRKR